MKAQALVDEVSRNVQDDSYQPGVILDILNQGLLEIAGWDNKEPAVGIVGTILLPALETTADVNLNPALDYVQLPDNYHKNLYAVTYPGLTGTVNILAGKKALIERWQSWGHQGPVEDVAVSGNRLYFRPLPAEEIILTLHYYRKPDSITLTDPADTEADIPSCLPEDLHRPLLVSYGCRYIWNEKEDSLDGQQANTIKYDGEFTKAMARLFKGITSKSKATITMRRRVRWF